MRGRLAISVVVALQCLMSEAAYPPPVPPQLELVVQETAGIARTGEVIRSGVPLPRSLDLKETTAFTIVDATATPVPAEFTVLARWHAAKADTAAPIQWVLVEFPATIAAGATSTYRLVTDGSAGVNPPPTVPLTVSQDGNEVTVSTGAATFVVGGTTGALFDEVRLASSTVLVAEGQMTARVAGVDHAHTTLRSVTVEHTSALSCVVSITGLYAMPAVGGGGLATLRRYEFRAGSPTALVRHVVSWEGSRCDMGALTCGGTPNGVLLEQVRDRLDLQLGPAPLTASLVGQRAAPAVTASVAAGQTASLEQLLRSSRLADVQFQLAVPGSTTTGDKADGGILGVSGSSGSLVVALNHMHRYEPQALRLLANGELAVDLVADTAWLANHQGTFATFAVSALPSALTRELLNTQVWAPLNAPLRAWPKAAWFAASQTVLEVPVGELPTELAAYDTLVATVLSTTMQKIDDKGLAGLQTFGVYPRYWGYPLYANELDCGGNDPTPADDWDDAFWCATWTDYHNALAAVPRWAMRSGEVAWLDELAVPGALRTLHTQIIQCAPSDTFFYCGQAPTGYGGYRSDNNASHAYFDNLVLYYWLSGDETVVKTLQRGANTMRGFVCPGRSDHPPDPVCAPTEPIPDSWAELNGRVASQWYDVYRFVGLASDDPSYLEDWSSNTARWLTQYYAEPQDAGTGLGFPVVSGEGSYAYVDGPGSYVTQQLWMSSLYDYELLHRLALDSGDAPLGEPSLTPSATIEAWARTLEEVSTLSEWSTGDAFSAWPNEVQFSYSGNRVGGVLTHLASEIDGDGDGIPCEICGDDDGGVCLDLCLYDTGKSTLAAPLLRAADLSGDSGLRDLGESFTLFGLAAVAADMQPLGKFMGEYLSSVQVGVARLTATQATIFSDGFESGDASAWSATAP